MGLGLGLGLEFGFGLELGFGFGFGSSDLDALESEDLCILQAALGYHVVQVSLELLVRRDRLLGRG